MPIAGAATSANSGASSLMRFIAITAYWVLRSISVQSRPKRLYCQALRGFFIRIASSDEMPIHTTTPKFRPRLSQRGGG
jgi:hypothetical protein